MRVAVISDTHLPKGSRVLPASCRDRLAAADLIVHAGDLTAVSFLDELESLGPPVEAVHGNVDEDAVRSRLPARLILDVEDVRLGVVHDAGPRSGREARLAALFPRCSAVVYGHTHLPQVELVEGAWILNPGSPTERRRAPARTMLELEVAGGAIVPQLVVVGT